MQTLVCDGCGKSELLSTPEKNRDLKAVRLTIILDGREAMHGDNRHESDLCGECRAILLHRYFRVREGVILEIPKFLAAANG